MFRRKKQHRSEVAKLVLQDHANAAARGDGRAGTYLHSGNRLDTDIILLEHLPAAEAKARRDALEAIVLVELETIDPRDRFRFPINVPITTRPPRPYERHRVDYHFVSSDVFDRYKAKGLLKESGTRDHTYMYGSFKPVPPRPLGEGEPEGKPVPPPYPRGAAASPKK